MPPATIRTADLRPHPRNEEIYQDQPDDDLVRSIADRGVMRPLIVTPRREILAGRRRWMACVELRLDTVPVIVMQPASDADAIQIIVADNVARTKTMEQRAREQMALAKCGPAPEPDASDDAAPDEVRDRNPPANQPKPIPRRTMTRARKVVRAIDAAEENGDIEAAAEIRAVLETQGVATAERIVEPPKEPGRHPVVLDGGGVTLEPGVVTDQFAYSRDLVRDLMSRVRELSRRIAEAAEGDGVEYLALSAPAIAKLMGQVVSRLSECVPYALCPKCRASAREIAKCEFCYQTGIITEPQFRSLKESDRRRIGHV
jgi:hypothetical protein